MMLAWFNSSETMKSSLPRIDGDRSRVRGEAALKDDRRLGLLERRQLSLELHVDVHRAGDRADRPDPTPSVRVASSARSRSFGCVVRPR